MPGKLQAHSPPSDASGPRLLAEHPCHNHLKEVAAPVSERSTISGTSGISVIQLGPGQQETAVATVAPAFAAGIDAGSGVARADQHSSGNRARSMEGSDRMGTLNVTNNTTNMEGTNEAGQAATGQAAGSPKLDAARAAGAGVVPGMGPALGMQRAFLQDGTGSRVGVGDGPGSGGGGGGDEARGVSLTPVEDLQQILTSAAAAANGDERQRYAISPLSGLVSGSGADADDGAAAAAAAGAGPDSAVAAAVAASRQMLKRSLPSGVDPAFASGSNGNGIGHGTGGDGGSEDPDGDNMSHPEGSRRAPAARPGSGLRAGQEQPADSMGPPPASRGTARAAGAPSAAAPAAARGPASGGGRARRVSAAAEGDNGSDAGDGDYGSLEDTMVPANLPAPVEVTVAVRVAAGRAGEEEQRYGNGSYIRGPVSGYFDPSLYMARMDCIRCGGTLVSRSHFEKMGGSNMAKWYRSIRVLPTMEPLGEWLERHGMPVLKGAARRSRPRKPLVHPSVVVTGPGSNTGMELSPVGSGGEASGGGGAACGSGAGGVGDAAEPPAKRRAAAGSVEGCSSSCADGDEWIRPPSAAAAAAAAGARGGFTGGLQAAQAQQAYQLQQHALHQQQLALQQQQQQQQLQEELAAYEQAGLRGGDAREAAAGAMGLLGHLPNGAAGGPARRPRRLSGRQNAPGPGPEGSVSGSPAEPNDDEALGTEALISLSMMLPGGPGAAAAAGAAAAPPRASPKTTALVQDAEDMGPAGQPLQSQRRSFSLSQQQQHSQPPPPQQPQRKLSVLGRGGGDAAGDGGEEAEGDGLSEGNFSGQRGSRDAAAAARARGVPPRGLQVGSPGASGLRPGGGMFPGAAGLRGAGPSGPQDAADPLAVARRVLAREAAAAAAAAAAHDGGEMVAAAAGAGVGRRGAADAERGVTGINDDPEEYIPQSTRGRPLPPRPRAAGDVAIKPEEQEFDLPVVQGPAAAAAAARRAAFASGGVYAGGPDAEYVRRAGLSAHNGPMSAGRGGRVLQADPAAGGFLPGRSGSGAAAAAAAAAAVEALRGPVRGPPPSDGALRAGAGGGLISLLGGGQDDVDLDALDDQQLQLQILSVGAPTLILSVDLERAHLLQRVQQLERLKARISELEHMRAGLGLASAAAAAAAAAAAERGAGGGAGGGRGPLVGPGRGYALHRLPPGAAAMLEGRQGGGAADGGGAERARERALYGAAAAAAAARGYDDVYGHVYGPGREGDDEDAEAAGAQVGSAGGRGWGPALMAAAAAAAQERGGYPGSGPLPMSGRVGGRRVPMPPGPDQLGPGYQDRFPQERYDPRAGAPDVRGRDDQAMDEDEEGGYYWTEAVPGRGGGGAGAAAARQSWPAHAQREYARGLLDAMEEGPPVSRVGRGAIPVHVQQQDGRPYMHLGRQDSGAAGGRGRESFWE